jgi:hypothetical protein
MNDYYIEEEKRSSYSEEPRSYEWRRGSAGDGQDGGFIPGTVEDIPGAAVE